MQGGFMASVDPNATFTREVSGIEFTFKELKTSGVRDIANTLKVFVSGKQDIIEKLDLLSACAMKYIVGWSKGEVITKESLEDELEIKDIVAVLGVATAGSRLSDEERKKLELPPSSSGESSANTAETSA
jgi:hypothetical protein